MSLTAEQLFQQALHDHASQLPTVADPAALGQRLRHRDLMVKLYRVAAAGGAVLVLVAGGLLFTVRQREEVRSAELPGATSATRHVVGTNPDTGEMILGDGSAPDPDHPGGTIILGDPGSTAAPDAPDSPGSPGDTSTTTTTLTSPTTTTTIVVLFGFPLPTLPNGAPDPNPATTQPGAPPTQPGATTVPPGPTTSQPGATTTSPTTVPRTAPTTTTSAPATTTTTPPPCAATISPSSGASPQTVTLRGRSLSGGPVTYASANAAPSTGQATTDINGNWQITGIVVRVPTRIQTITIKVTCPDGSTASPTYTRR